MHEIRHSSSVLALEYCTNASISRISYYSEGPRWHRAVFEHWCAIYSSTSTSLCHPYRVSSPASPTTTLNYQTPAACAHNVHPSTTLRNPTQPTKQPAFAESITIRNLSLSEKLPSAASVATSLLVRVSVLYHWSTSAGKASGGRRSCAGGESKTS